jgi:thiol-disulfide isomerase/thioredoxin
MRLSLILVAVLTLALAGSCSAQPGTGPAPAWTLTDLKGKPVSLADYRGKVVLVNFWATWCPPCRAEIPELISIQTQYHDRGFSVLGLSVDSSGPNSVAQFAQAQGMNYPIVMADETTADAYGADQGIPVSALVDQQGVVRWSHLGYIDEDDAKQLRETIDGLLGAAHGASGKT